jgi:uncharacterized protein
MPQSPKVSVRKSAIHGSGLFAEQPIRKGQVIGYFEGSRTMRDGTHVIWIEDEAGEQYGLRLRGPLRYINHAKRPNAKFQGERVVARRAIRRDEEITCHYGEDWEDDD